MQGLDVLASDLCPNDISVGSGLSYTCLTITATSITGTPSVQARCGLPDLCAA